ncbi:hypothetical protein [Actinophytocola sp.]|uniref:hypothetical protein n=1 Tax=Actinophytocola sp. TaxID=1872138 RepID=UPI002D7F17F3|nr:hypothetical protein [Actinophytocola sp.]HET9140157.1 hypothetical protein [Actinophytocola sp.]
MTAPPPGYQPSQPGYPPSQPGYQPSPPAQQYYYGPQQPQARPPRPPRRARWVGGIIAAVLFLLATGATVWGLLEDVQTYNEQIGSGSFGVHETWWYDEQTTDRGSIDRSTRDSHLNGLPVVAAAALLLVGAVLALSAAGTRRAGLVSAARTTSALGIGLLFGAVLIQLLDGLDLLEAVNDRELDEDQSVTFQLGLGIWLPGGAAVVALIALLLTLTGRRMTASRVEPETPRFGVPAPYGAPPPGYQQHGQYPASQPFPVQQPVSQPIPQQPAAAQPEAAPQQAAAQPESPPPPQERPADPEPTPQPADEPPADETQRTTDPGDQPRI